MSKKICLLFCRLRLFLLGVFNPESEVGVLGFSNISRGTDIEIGRNSRFCIGRGLHTRSGVVLAVRDNASLIIGNDVFINRNTIITARNRIRIGDGVTIGPNVCIYDHDHDVFDRGAYVLCYVEIKDNVWIGANVLILSGVTIGENAVVAAGSIVTRDVPANTMLIQRRHNTLRAL